MPAIQEYNNFGIELENKLKLRTSPIALKMLKKESEIPEHAFRPKRDKGIHIAQCQAFAMSRRDGMTVAMLKEDHWCMAPLVAYGFVDEPKEPEVRRFFGFPTFKRNEYLGILTAPLKKATFEPDLVLVYSDVAQQRTMLMPLHFFGEEPPVNSHFFPPSCAYTVIPVFNKKQLFVAPPDIGEDMRTIGAKEEIITSIPAEMLEDIVKGLQTPIFEGADFMHSPMIQMADFEQPDLYKQMFTKWGLYDEDK
ncbi:MAG: DUF169 domain-containing protein [Spirochaetes bacterium]|nr:DUF169 domain-containing protein [Spirochaetota bacterium]